MQKVRGHPEGLPLFVGIRFQVLFHPPLGVLFTFPSRYSFTIGHQVVLSLGRWSSQLPPGFHVSQGTREHRQWRSHQFRLRGSHPLRQAFPDLSTIGRFCNSTLFMWKQQSGPTTPIQQRPHAYTGSVWAIPRSLAATRGVSLISFPAGT